MDYHSVHGNDISSFDLPSAPRMPSVSAAQALQDLEAGVSQPIPTGLDDLDRALASDALGGSLATSVTPGGVQRCQITEIWGPPGSGKTTFGLQLIHNVLNDGKGVVWVDGFHPLCSQRLGNAVKTPPQTDEANDDGNNMLNGFTHYHCPTLAHFLALLCQTAASDILPSGTSLIVIDSLSALINYAFPRIPELKSSNSAGGNKAPKQSFQRIQALQHITTSLQKLAAARNLAVVVLSQCITKMQADQGATLVPAIAANVWENGISTRVVLFRDWIWDGDESRSLHFAGIQKSDGRGHYGPINNIAAFSIKPDGLVAVACEANQTPSIALSATPAQKRKRHDTSFEVADSDDEDYGWAEDDEDAVPPMPSQWQGSEDLIIGTQPPSSDRGEDLEEDEELEDGNESATCGKPRGQAR